MRPVQTYHNISRKLVLVVGGYSSGALLAPALRAHGYSCLHIQPADFITPLITGLYHPDDYIEQIIWKGDITALKAKLVGLGVQENDFKNLHVIAGSEVGVMVADAIAEGLQTKTRNVFELSEARRHKQAMQAALKKAGVRSIAGFKTADFGAIEAWMLQNKVNYPIVIKPDASAGTDHVAICKNREEAELAFTAVLSSRDVEGKANHVVSVQEFIKGEEYVVNTVSRDGEHYLTDILHVRKVTRPGGSPAYDTAELLCPVVNAALYATLGAYVKTVLPALGIRNGAGHSEVIIDEKGPVLVETGARTMGAGLDPAGYTLSLGYNHPSATVAAYLTPHLLPRMLLPETKERLFKHQLCVFMLSPVEGTITQEPDLSAFTRISEFFSAKMASRGWSVGVTTSLNNCPGLVNLVGDSSAALHELYGDFREREATLFAQMLQPSPELPTADNPYRLTTPPTPRRELMDGGRFSLTPPLATSLQSSR